MKKIAELHSNYCGMVKAFENGNRIYMVFEETPGVGRAAWLDPPDMTALREKLLQPKIQERGRMPDSIRTQIGDKIMCCQAVIAGFPHVWVGVLGFPSACILLSSTAAAKLAEILRVKSKPNSQRRIDANLRRVFT